MKPQDTASFKPPQKAQAGKGDKPRPIAKPATFRDNFDAIFRKPK